ncbi:hypothetical protein CEP53_006621 [Fusarium sp. AF-6]|nr:hypothetical protein CEP53_006621 [Fusarium sp. AF-6]
MASRIIGEPFGSGEQIDGWRACAVSGGIYVGLGPDNRDQLLNAEDGSSAKFRYVQSGHGFQRATLDTKGDGTIQVFMNNLLVGTTDVRGNGKSVLTLTGVGSDRYEMELRVVNGLSIAIRSITLE